MDDIMSTELKKGLSDDAFDAIAAVIIIAVVVAAVAFWLSGMPS